MQIKLLHLFRSPVIGAFSTFFIFLSCAASQQPAPRPAIEITAGPAADGASGRLLLFAEKIDSAAAQAPTEVDADPFFKSGNFVAAREVGGLVGGAKLSFHEGDLAYPRPLEQLAPGEYWVQALLDRDHSYAYSGRGAGDVVSEVVRLTLPRQGPPLGLTLSSTKTATGPWEFPDGHTMFRPEEQAQFQARIKPLAVDSPLLRAFTGRPMTLKGYVLTPPGYDASSERYPVVYFTHGFQAGMVSLADSAVGVLRQTLAGRLPPMIWVFLDQSGPTGTHEFADSLNNGPWGAALTRELLPEIDRQYRSDVQAGRYLMGHSSGGWAALWLQITYPALFRGAWATSPDYCDFTDYAGVDITRPGARIDDLAMAHMEVVLGEYGGQESSFDWVFSPRGADGRPLRMYERGSGLVNRQVADYWRANWDISQIIRRRWPQLKGELDGKVHVIVGDQDQFRLNISAHKLEEAFKAVGGRASFTYVPGRGHFDLYGEGAERMALRRKIGWQIWRVARPDSALGDPGPPPAVTAVPALSLGW